MQLGAAQLVGRDNFVDGGLDKWRPSKEDVTVLLENHRLVRHARNVCAAGSAGAQHHAYLRNAGSRHVGLIVENTPKVIAVGETFALQRKIAAPRVDQIAE